MITENTKTVKDTIQQNLRQQPALLWENMKIPKCVITKTPECVSKYKYK